MGNTSLDDVRELADDFATELRRKNRAKKTIDVYRVHIANGCKRRIDIALGY